VRKDGPLPELDPAVRSFYERGNETHRLAGGFPSGPLELARTKELIDRYLPGGRLQVLVRTPVPTRPCNRREGNQRPDPDLDESIVLLCRSDPETLPDDLLKNDRQGARSNV
jgi:hypothetical protein